MENQLSTSLAIFLVSKNDILFRIDFSPVWECFDVVIDGWVKKNCDTYAEAKAFLQQEYNKVK